MDRYGYQCEYCEGMVRPKKVAQEAFKHKKGFVILENVTIGVCDVCGNRYYRVDIIHTVQEIAAGIRMPERIDAIPVAKVT